MKDYTKINTIKTDSNFTLDVDDPTLSGMITAASRAIDHYCGREEGFFVADDEATVRYYAGSGKGYQFIDPFIEIVELGVKENPLKDAYTTWTYDTDYWVFSGEPEFPNFNSLPFSGLLVNPGGNFSRFTSGQWEGQKFYKLGTTYGKATKTVKVSARWGYSDRVPADIERACIMLVTRWFNRQRGGMTDTLVSGNLGRLIYTQKIDPDIAFILDEGGWVLPASSLLQ